MSTKLSISELRELIYAGNGKDPLVFLEAVMSGQDPRVTSQLFNLVEDIHEFSEGNPDSNDWKQLHEFIKENVKYRSPSITESLAAAKTLSEYLHPKRKQIDITGSMGGGSGEVEPLTTEEVELFREKWNDEY